MPMISSLRSWLRRPGPRRPDRPFVRARLSVEALEARAVPASLLVGANVNTGHMTGSQSETAIAINPANPKQLFVETNDNAAINSTGSGMYVSRSADGGKTWTASVVAAGGADGLPLGFSDPSLAWDSFGNLFMSYINTPAAGGGVANYTIALSTNGGATFKSIATLACADQPHLAVGAGEVAAVCNNGSVQVSSAKVTGVGTVGGFSTVTVPNSNGLNFGGIAIGPKGQIEVCFQNSGSGVGPDNIQVSNAAGVGAAFGNPTIATATNVGGFRPIPPQPVRTIDAESKVAYDDSNGPHKGRLYLVYTNAPSTTSNDTNIFLRHSDNNGATWSAPLRVNDDRGTNSQFFSSLAVDQSTGNLALSWYDARNSANNTEVECFATVSVNGGLSVLPNVQVAKGLSSAIAAGNNSGNDYGDFMTVAFVNNHLFPCWVDNSTTLPGNTDRPNFDIGTANVTFLGVPTPGPSVPIPKIFYPLRYDFDPLTGTYSGFLTLTNVGGGFLTGPATFLFTHLPPGVTLVNAMGTKNGFPFIKVSFSPLGPNQFIRVKVVFTNPFNQDLSTFFEGFPITLLLG
jgi:hypothetical protein